MGDNGIFTAAVVGGPGGGKDSCRPMLIERLSDCGIPTFMAPETATILFGGGVRISDIGDLTFQKRLAELQFWQENHWLNIVAAHSGERKALFFNRGLLDARAYLPGGNDYFEKEILEPLHKPNDEKLNIIRAMARYDSVYFMRSPAVDAPHIYEQIKGNNSARLETVEQAKERDLATYHAWNGHEHIQFMENTDDDGNIIDFAAKLAKLEKAVFHDLGIPLPLEIERKYLVNPDIDPRRLLNAVPVNIVQTYLLSHSDLERRIRARRYGDSDSLSAAYIYTEKKDQKGISRFQNERIISSHGRDALMHERDTKLDTLLKTRWSFTRKGLYYQLDVFAKPRLVILEVETTEEMEHIYIPNDLKKYIIKDITEDRRYRNHSVAAGECPCYNY